MATVAEVQSVLGQIQTLAPNLNLQVAGSVGATGADILDVVVELDVTGSPVGGTATLIYGTAAAPAAAPAELAAADAAPAA